MQVALDKTVVVAVLVLWAFSASGQVSAPVRWYAVSQELNERGSSLHLGDRDQLTVELRGGWSCVVGAASNRWPLSEGRQTTCSKVGDSFEFSVSCDPRKPQEHVQIRFRGADRQPVDFIEVGCEVMSSGR
jgi:hypothetical protein